MFGIEEINRGSENREEINWEKSNG